MSSNLLSQLNALKELHLGMRENQQIPPETIESLEQASALIESIQKGLATPNHQTDYLDLISDLTQQNTELLALILDDPAARPKFMNLSMSRNLENTRQSHIDTSAIENELGQLHQELVSLNTPGADLSFRDLLSEEEGKDIETRSIQLTPSRDGALSPISAADSFRTASDPHELQRRLIEMEAKYVLLQSPFGRKSDRYTIYRNKLREQNKELRKLLEQKTQLINRICLYKDENERLLRQIGSVAALKEKLRKLNAMYTSREQQISSMRDEMAKADSRMKAAIRQARQEKQQLVKTISELSSAMPRRPGEAALTPIIEAEDGEIFKLEANLQRAEERTRQIAREKATCERENEKITEMLRERENEFQQEKGELLDNAKRLENEAHEKAATIVEKEREITELKKNNAKSAENIKNNETVIRANAENIEQLETVVQTNSGSIEQLGQHVSSLTRENTQLRETLEIKVETIKSMDEDILELRTQNKTIAELTATISSLRHSQLQTEQEMHLKNTSLEEQLKLLQVTHDETRDSLEVNITQTSQLQEQLTTTATEVAQAQEQLQETTQEKVNLEKTILELETKLAVATVELKSLKKKYDLETTGLNEKIQNYETSTAEQVLQLKALQKDLKSAKTNSKSTAKSTSRPKPEAPSETMSVADSTITEPKSKGKPKDPKEKKKSSRKPKEEDSEEPIPSKKTSRKPKSDAPELDSPAKENKKSSKKPKTESISEQPEDAKKSRKNKEKPAEEEKRTKKHKEITPEDEQKKHKDTGEEKKSSKKPKETPPEEEKKTKKSSRKIKEVPEEPTLPDEKKPKKRPSKSEKPKTEE